MHFFVKGSEIRIYQKAVLARAKSQNNLCSISVTNQCCHMAVNQPSTELIISTSHLTVKKLKVYEQLFIRTNLKVTNLTAYHM